MQRNPGATILLVLVLFVVVGGVVLNAVAIYHLEGRIGPAAGTDGPTPAGTDANGDPAVRRFPDGTLEARGVLILPNGVVIVPDGSRARVYTRDGRLITGGAEATDDGTGDGTGNTPPPHEPGPDTTGGGSD